MRLVPRMRSEDVLERERPRLGGVPCAVLAIITVTVVTATLVSTTGAKTPASSKSRNQPVMPYGAPIMSAVVLSGQDITGAITMPGGTARTYSLYVPKSLPKGKPVPLALHGGSGTAGNSSSNPVSTGWPRPTGSSSSTRTARRSVRPDPMSSSGMLEAAARRLSRAEGMSPTSPSSRPLSPGSKVTMTSTRAASTRPVTPTVPCWPSDLRANSRMRSLRSRCNPVSSSSASARHLTRLPSSKSMARTTRTCRSTVAWDRTL
jgi:hypothetical protein